MKNQPHRKPSVALIISIIAMICSVASSAYCVYDYINQSTSLGPISFAPDSNSANFTEGSIADIAAKVSPAVVSITTEYKSSSPFSSGGTGGGTGMIISPDGYVMTNKHVMENATDAEIFLADGRSFNDLTLIYEDPVNDVAFLKINGATDLPTVTIGSSKTISVGQQVLVIGNALGEYQNSVTSGIISGIGRSITASSSDYSSTESLSDMIQTDAAINSGNSGGPLVNAAGEVIGINTATSSTAEAIGFAIPISSISGVISEILETGTAARAYLGIYYINLTPTIASEYDLNVRHGAYLHSSTTSSTVMSGSPADKAGLKNEDIIIAVNNNKIKTGASLGTLLGECHPGDEISLVVLRDGREITLSATLGAYPTK